MIEITNMEVRSYAYDRLELTWRIADTSEEVHDYLISIFRSESAGGPWDQLVTGIEDKYSFMDGAVDLRNRWRQYWYKLRLTRKSDSSTKDTEPVSLMAPIDLIAAEVQAREAMHFQKNVGRKMLLFPIRTFGQRCHCYNSVLELPKHKKCPNCYGTTYLRGYLDPVVIWCQRDPATKSEQFLPNAKTQQVHTILRMGSYPPVKPQDVIVDRENRRWRTVTATPTERLNTTIRQELQMSEIMPGGVEHELPVDSAVFDNYATEVRHFSRPSTL